MTEPTITLSVSQVPNGSKFFWLVETKHPDGRTETEAGTRLFDTDEECEAALREHYKAQKG